MRKFLQHQFQDPFHPSILNFTQARIIKGRSIESRSVKNKRFLLLDFDGALTCAHGLIYPRVESVVELFHDIYDVGSLESFESSIYIGDSPNDEPLFRLRDSSYGVKNVESYLKTLRYPPRNITTQNEGMGAAEVLEGLVKDLRKRPA